MDDVARVARKILDNFVQPFRVNSRDSLHHQQIGITIFPFDVHDAEGLLKNADAAMYHAKGVGPEHLQILHLRTQRARRAAATLETACARRSPNRNSACTTSRRWT